MMKSQLRFKLKYALVNSFQYSKDHDYKVQITLHRYKNSIIGCSYYTNDIIHFSDGTSIIIEPEIFGVLMNYHDEYVPSYRLSTSTALELYHILQIEREKEEVKLNQMIQENVTESEVLASDLKTQLTKKICDRMRKVWYNKHTNV